MIFLAWNSPPQQVRCSESGLTLELAIGASRAQMEQQCRCTTQWLLSR
jgi:hypothetical protein